MAKCPAVAGCRHVGGVELLLCVVVGAVQDPRRFVRVAGPEKRVGLLHAVGGYFYPAPPAEWEARIRSEGVKNFHVCAPFFVRGPTQ